MILVWVVGAMELCLIDITYLEPLKSITQVKEKGVRNSCRFFSIKFHSREFYYVFPGD